MPSDVHHRPDVAALYDLDPSEFVAARDALVKQVRADDRAAAEAIKALRRPTVAAWAVNRAARARPDDVERLLTLGRDLREGQASLRDAMGERRALIAAIADAAVDLAGESHRAEIEPTVEAASLDDELADAFRHGHLDRAAEPSSGLDTLLAMAPPAGTTDVGPDPAVEARRAELRARLREADAALAAADERVAAAQAALDDARAARDEAKQARAAIAAELDDA